MLLEQSIRKFFDYLSSIDRSEETTRGYKTDLRLFSRFLEKKYNCTPYLEEVTATDIEDYLLWLK